MLSSLLFACKRHAVLAVVLAANALVPKYAVAESDQCGNLQRRIDAVVPSKFEATLSIAVLDLRTRCSAAIGGDQPIPMMSVYKLPIMLTALAAADQGLDLSRRVTITRADIVGGHSPLADELRKKKRLTRSLWELASEAMLDSDNTSSDVLLTQLGGPAAVAKFLREKGHGAIAVNRFEREIERDYDVMSMMNVLAERRDSSSANDMVKLIEDLYAGRLMSERATRQAIDLMGQVATGQKRLRAGLGPQWRLAHKTGTGELPSGLNIATNDAGMIESPIGRRMIAVVLVGPGHARYADREALIAEVARQASAWIEANPDQ